MSNDHPLRFSPTDLEGPLGLTLIALNNDNARELSWLEPGRLSHLTRVAFLALRIGGGDALLLAFDQSADYDSPDYLWFRRHYARFVYIDRVVVTASARRLGHARRLYDALFHQALAAGHDRVVCEVNADPPNPASDAFHAAMGFKEVGQATHYPGETVRYFSRDLMSRVAR